uniref:Putative secreted protein n=1 Tax=Anopheles darlingi TaxID=43151 RepID=A0A2M4D9J4_ANODA
MTLLCRLWLTGAHGAVPFVTALCRAGSHERRILCLQIPHATLQDGHLVPQAVLGHQCIDDLAHDVVQARLVLPYSLV